MDIQAKGLDYRALNEAIRAAGPSCRITGCLGQRFIGAGMSGRRVEIDVIPGNALGAYLGGGSLTVNHKHYRSIAGTGQGVSTGLSGLAHAIIKAHGTLEHSHIGMSSIFRYQHAGGVLTQHE